MRTTVLKLLCWLLVAATTNILAYQNTNTNSKSAYTDTLWTHKSNTKDYSNRYASLMMASTKTSGSSTTYKPPWPNSKTETTTKLPLYNSYSYDNNNNNSPVRLRHSRYPNLDGVLMRLDKMRTTTKPPMTTAPPLYQYHRYHDSKTDNNLFHDNYDDDTFDYDDDDDDDDDEDDEFEEGNNDNLGGSEEDDEDDFDGWQAEEATENAPSSLTEFKWQHFGTRSRVEETRRKQNYPEHTTSYAEVNAAIQHALRMNKESRCRDPLPRVMSVQNEHPDPGKSYVPHCTVLHRCAEDTGCCPNHSTRCAPKKQVVVHLYFYTTVIGKLGSKVEKLPFYNHTECACLDKGIQPTIDVATSEESHEVTRPYRSSLSVRAADFNSFSSPETIRKCKCPEEYSPRLHRGTVCSCDCADGNLDCALIKRGKEFFSLKDRLCIKNGQCGYPSCEYGAYMRNVGRCPRKQEKIEAFASVATNVN